MSRSSRRRRGRTYQPLPERRNPWIARMLVVGVGLLLIFGSLAFLAGTQ